MENKDINIAEILKDCPEGTKLYSPLFGELKFGKLDSSEHYPILIDTDNSRAFTFDSNGRFYSTYPTAECLLFPSSEMRDWTKFFKRGDVAIHSFNGCGVLVEEWTDDSYTSFKASVFQLKKGGFAKRDKRVLSIDDFVKASDEQRDKFISDMEKFFGGKYNPDTLQVEKSTCPFMPFDKVLVRDTDEQTWCANYFSHYKNDPDYFLCLYKRHLSLLHPLQRAYRPPPRHNRPIHGRRQRMSCPFSLENVKFRETAHIAFEDEYVTAYQSTDIVPKIYKSVNTPRDKSGLASGKPKTYYRTRYSSWVTEKTFITQYPKIREKF